MGKFWTRQMKGLVLCLAALLCAMIFLSNALWMWQSRQYGRICMNIVGNLKAQYPEIREEEVIRILSGKENGALGAKVLGHYGLFFGNWETFQKMQGQSFANDLLLGNLVLFLLALGCLAGVVLYHRGRRRSLAKLCIYMDRVSHGEFDLQVEENREDEFSGLRNELYKLMVLYKKQAEHAMDNKKALADAVADISHQLKTPLTSMAVLADNLIENRDMEEETRLRFEREIARQLGGMKWLVTTMLKISRLDANVVTLEKNPVDLRELTQEVIQNLEIGAQFKEVRLESRVSGEGRITGDRKWLAEALSNVVKNAIEHSPQGGLVEILATDNDVYTQIRVTDQGEGIPKEQQRHLFERFYQGAATGPDNVGIGLALAKEIVEKQGGYITVESGAQGTSFFIKFIKCH